MARKYVDCREMPSDSKCTVAISADSEKELIEVAVQHAVKVHGHHDTTEFRQMLKKAIKEGSSHQRPSSYPEQALHRRCQNLSA